MEHESRLGTRANNLVGEGLIDSLHHEPGADNLNGDITEVKIVRDHNYQPRVNNSSRVVVIPDNK